MKILYYIYQICIALPILLVLTILTAIVTIVGSLVGGAHFWGYYPGKIWSQLICLFLLIPVKIRGREKLHGKTSYIFVPNHQGSFDIFLIYGFIGRNFKWMMKKSLRKLPFVGKACESAGHIFVDRSGPKKVLETIQQAKASLKDGVSLGVFPEGARTRPSSEPEGIPGMESKSGGICGLYRYDPGPEGQGASDGTTGRPVGEQFYFPTGSPSRSNRPDPE